MRIIIAALNCLVLSWLFSNPTSACTSFCMDTPNGPVFGSNLDLFIPGDGLVLVNRRGIEKEGWQTSTTGERAKWTSRYGSVTFSVAGRGFAWGGMNEAGLVVSSMELREGRYPEPDDRPPLLDGNWGQYVLDTCGSIEEVARTGSILRVEDQVYTSHYLVADSTGACAAIEYLDGEFVYSAGSDLPVKAMTNMQYAHALEALEQGGVPWWWSNPGRSAERFAACYSRSAAYDPAPDTSAIDYAFETLTRVVAAPHTKWNIVYDIAGREIWFRTVRSPAVKHVSLDTFDFSCEAQKLMLDVNIAQGGDVRDHFEPYDPGVNLNLFRTFCARFGIEVSEQTALNLTAHFDGFECSSGED